MSFVILIAVFASFSVIHELQGQEDKFSCRDMVFNCKCGNRGYIFQAYFKQCHYWLPPEHACARYSNCLECETGVERCISCPPNRYGRQCWGECQCGEGQACNRDTGQCDGKGAVGSPVTIPSSTLLPTVLCVPPPVQPPIEQKQIREQGILVAIEYTCPDPYTLNGVRIIICNDGKWNNDPPKCGIICFGFPLPSMSDDFPYPKDAATDVKDCRDVIFTCDCGNPGYKMQAVIKQCHFWVPPEQACTRFQHCLECVDGQDECAMCPPGRYGRWCNGECKCQNGGTCDNTGGSCRCPPGYGGKNCEKRTVLTLDEITCQTKGSDITSKIEDFVNITCPPGCEGHNVWGTSIYSQDSSVCASAIHAGFIPKNGGSIYLVNNGLYNNFVPSISKGVNSLGGTGDQQSFRFSSGEGQPIPEKKEDCPNGWIHSNGLCVKTAKPEKAWEIAKCTSDSQHQISVTKSSKD